MPIPVVFKSNSNALVEASKYGGIAVCCEQDHIPNWENHTHLSEVDNLNACIRELNDDVVILSHDIELQNNSWMGIISSIPGASIVGQKHSVFRQMELGINQDEISNCGDLLSMNQVFHKNIPAFYFTIPGILFVNKEVYKDLNGFDNDLGFSAAGVADFCIRAYWKYNKYTALVDELLGFHSVSNTTSGIDILKKKYGATGDSLLEVSRTAYARKIFAR